MSIATKPILIAVAEGASSLDILAARHRAAWDKTQHGRAEWIEGTLELAAVLAEERKLLPDHREFSRWLERNGLAEIDPHARIALIGMAKDLVATRKMLETNDYSSWEYIWKSKLKTTLRSSPKGEPAPAKRKSKLEGQLIEKVLKLHCDQGHSYKETAEELGLTIGKVASMVRRFSNTRQPGPPPMTMKQFTGLKTLTREQVDPDFKGTELQFRTKYGHVPLHTKEQIEENKRQEELATWLAAVSDLEQAARALVNAKTPDQNTLRQYLAKPGKAERLNGRLTLIENAWFSGVAHYLDLIRSQQKS